MDNYIGKVEFISIIDTGNGNLALGDNMVIVDVVRQQTVICHTDPGVLGERERENYGYWLINVDW